MDHKLYDDEKILKEIILQEGGDLELAIKKTRERGWLSNQIETYLRSLFIKSPKEFGKMIFRKVISKRLQKIQPWRWKNEKKIKVEKTLESLSLKQLKKLFLFLTESSEEIIRKVLKDVPAHGSLNEFLKLFQSEEIENFLNKRKFSQLIFQEKFREEGVEFPTIILTVIKSGKEKPNNKFTLQFNKAKIMGYSNFPIGTQIVIRPKRFQKPYGQIFELVKKDNNSFPSERIVRKSSKRYFFFILFSPSRHQRHLLAKWFKGEEILLSSFRHFYKRKTRFCLYLAGKKISASLNHYCQDNEEIEVVPVKERKSYFFEFYKLKPEKKLLKRYEIKRNSPSLLLVYQAKK